MNHSYRIVTCKVDETSSHQRYFVARRANVYVEIGGKCIEAPYPKARFEGTTYASAMLKTNAGFKKWLANIERHQLVVGF